MAKPEVEIANFFREYRRHVMVRSLDQRLAVVRRVSQARAFLKGEPSDWWDGVNWRWRAASEFSEYNSDNAPRFNHHINIFSAGWQILQSAIQTTGIPGSIFTPQNQGQQEDREAARRRHVYSFSRSEWSADTAFG